MPGVGESNLLYKIVKNDGSAKQDRFRPHLFQEIDIDKTDVIPVETGKEADFEPLDLNGSCIASPVPEDESAEMKTFWRTFKRVLTPMAS